MRDHTMNNRGGRRPGAGRPVGSKNQRSAEIARAAAESGITPIEVMLGTMRELWAVGTPEAKREAAEIAKDAAPFTRVLQASTKRSLSNDPLRYWLSLTRMLKSGKRDNGPQSPRTHPANNYHWKLSLWRKQT